MSKGFPGTVPDDTDHSKNSRASERNEDSTAVLYTERLILRKFTEEDLPALFQIFSEEKGNRFLPWFPLRTFEEARSFYEKHYAEPYERRQGFRYAICLQSDNIPIGYITISTDESHDLGYGLREIFWNRGIVTEAGRKIVEAAKKGGIPYVTATHDRNNPRSGRVMQKLGMRYQYSYEEQWQPKNELVTFRLYQLNLDGNAGRIYRKYWETSEVHFVEKVE